VGVGVGVAWAIVNVNWQRFATGSAAAGLLDGTLGATA
jgi:hypothetical protein